MVFFTLVSISDQDSLLLFHKILFLSNLRKDEKREREEERERKRERGRESEEGERGEGRKEGEKGGNER